jgi:hypothetical protein
LYGNHNYRRLAELYKLMNGFWDEFKNVPRADRPGLAELCVIILKDHGVTQWDLQCLRMRHPSIRIKDKRPRFTVLDILADFVMDVKMKEEKDAEYQVMNVETEYRRDNRRQEKEAALILDEQVNGYDSSWPTKSIIGEYEHSFNDSNPVEEEVFNRKASGQVNAEEFQKDLLEVKANANKYVKKFADNSAWNEDKPHIKRSKRRVRAAIRKLDINRVKTCRVCKNGFYSRNGRYICDVMRSKENESISVCDREYRKNYKKFTESA